MTGKKILVFVTGFLSIGIAITAYRFLFMDLESAFQGMEGHIFDRRVWFLMHIIGAPIALALGFFQFPPNLRQTRPRLHHWSGRIFGVAIVMSGIGGLIMALGIMAERPVAGLGFGILAVLWVGVTVFGISAAMRREFAMHQRWMFRSFALTFAAVTLRLQLPFLFMGGMEYVEAANIVAWTCWVPNLIFAEWWLRRTPRRVIPA